MQDNVHARRIVYDSLLRTKWDDQAGLSESGQAQQLAPESTWDM